MKTTALSLCLLAALLLAPLSSHAQVSCTRGGLQRAVELYLDAQRRGDPSALPLMPISAYWENTVLMDIGGGLINQAMKIDHQLSLYDEDSCQSFTEVIVTDPEKPYVLGARLRVNHDKIAEIEILWTTTGYWLFNAGDYLKYATAEDWRPIAPAERASRGTLVAAANAYLDAFLEKKIDLVPWGYPCERTEGGAHTGEGSPDDSCEVGVPAGVNIVNRRFVVDEVLGSVVVYCTFGAGTPGGSAGPADTHLFRVEGGKLRYVHTLTHLLQADFQGERGGDRALGSERHTVNRTPDRAMTTVAFPQLLSVSKRRFM